jgi:hypothetical protein
MKEQMINGLTTLLAHTTPLYNINILPTKIVHGKDLTSSSSPRKKLYVRGNLHPPDKRTW